MMEKSEKMESLLKNRKGRYSSYSPRRIVQELQNEVKSKWTIYHYLLLVTFALMAYNAMRPRVEYVMVESSALAEMEAPSLKGGIVPLAQTEKPRSVDEEADEDEQEIGPTEDYGDDASSSSSSSSPSKQEQQQQEEQDDGGKGDMTLEEAMNRPFPDFNRMKEEDMYENYDDYINSPVIFLPEIPQRRGEWWGLQDYIRLYQTRVIRRHIPVLKKHIQLNQDNFNNYFRKNGQPFLFRSDNLRKAGFTGRGFTWEELQRLFPYEQSMDGKTFSQYRPNGKFDGEEIDLGPGLAAIIDDGQIIRRNGLRNFPRNMKVKPSSLKKLSVQWPPLIPMNGRQRPALWMGTSTSGTAFHSDCCDNFVMMLAGTKRITLAPTTDHHLLRPRCVGKNRGLCYANIPEPNAPDVSSSHYNKMIVDVKPGELLYMPAGWFHHIENMGPTLMTNFWTHGAFSCGVTTMNKFTKY